ncbi:heterokaryon incompatibility protein-domain-containing protein [Scleroderma yunnanense]
MRLINIKAFLGRDQFIREGKQVDRRTKVLEFRDDEATAYAILSHRWLDKEVDYDEMVDLAKMDREERDEICQCDGYRKILEGCEQAKRDGYEWLWVDTCCIDKRSSAELSEAINSMYRWYANSRVCYAYLHDVEEAFPTKRDDAKYPKSNGRPEWFSRGWTLQEMIAPTDVRFFNKRWRPIGDKSALAPTLSNITRVPENILTNGLPSNRPCVAQIMSWAAGRTTTRVEDRAYSLLGLLDVNMPMLYGEGKKAFHRLQVEIIRISNDQSIFAWGSNQGNPRIGSILADDPSFFRGCEETELMDLSEFIQAVKDDNDVPTEELPSVNDDRFGVFPITNRGIQIWMLLCPLGNSDSAVEAWLPCRHSPSLPPTRITLVLWDSNYCRYFTPPGPTYAEQILQFRQVYLRYQDAQHRVTFEIDDSLIIRNGFTCLGTYPSKYTGNTLTLTSTDPLCVKVYSDSQAHCVFAVGFGQCLSRDWIFIYETPTSEYSWEGHPIFQYYQMLLRGPEHARSMPLMRSRERGNGHLWFKRTPLLGSTWTVVTSYVVWEGSSKRDVKIGVFPYPCHKPDQWTGVNVEETDDPNCDIRGLMIPYSPRSEFSRRCELRVNGVMMKFLVAHDGVELGDYGYFTDSDEFCCEGNIFADRRWLSSEVDFTPREHKIDHVDWRSTYSGGSIILTKPIGLSLPSNPDFSGLLVSFSTRLINKYLVTRVIQCDTINPSGWS